MRKMLLLAVACLLAATTLKAVPTVHLIGDSTVCIWRTGRYPQQGWGQQLPRLFQTGTVAINNTAVSGASSLTFYNSYWSPVIASVIAGDYVFIQFGHNDSHVGAPEYTEPWTTYQQYLIRYIDQTRAKGAYPVLVTPCERNTGGWSNGKLIPSHGDYPASMRAVAASKACPLIDLTARTIAGYEALGQTYTTTKIFMNLPAGQFPNYPNGNSDNSHFQENGAKLVSLWVTDGIRANTDVHLKTLATYLTTTQAGYQFEAENLSILGSSGDSATPSSGDSNLSNSAGLSFAANAAGDSITLLLPNVAAGNYQIKVGVKNYTNRGIFQVATKAASGSTFGNIGSAKDQYASGVVYTEFIIGSFQPATTSDKHIRFTITGKNSSSSDYRLFIDYIKLVPQ
ncbi:MAG: rhamnogalacturonan acetylesterase [Nibricoccus sp.]